MYQIVDYTGKISYTLNRSEAMEYSNFRYIHLNDLSGGQIDIYNELMKIRKSEADKHSEFC